MLSENIKAIRKSKGLSQHFALLAATGGPGFE